MLQESLVMFMNPDKNFIPSKKGNVIRKVFNASAGNPQMSKVVNW